MNVPEAVRLHGGVLKTGDAVRDDFGKGKNADASQAGDEEGGDDDFYFHIIFYFPMLANFVHFALDEADLTAVSRKAMP